MNIFAHTIIAIITGCVLFHNNPEYFIAYVLGNTLIDIDHVIYAMVGEKIYSPKKMRKWMHQKYAQHEPHWYIFHNVETMVIALVFGYWLGGFAFAFAIGIVVHNIIDILSYLYIYRSVQPRGHYYVPTLNLLRKHFYS